MNFFKSHSSNFLALLLEITINKLLTYKGKFIEQIFFSNHKKFDEIACRFSVSYKQKNPAVGMKDWFSEIKLYKIAWWLQNLPMPNPPFAQSTHLYCPTF